MPTKKITELKLSTTKILQLRQNCIYGWRRKKGWLYIGVSTKGLGRLCNAHKIFDGDDLKETDVFHIYLLPFLNTHEIMVLEKFLIRLIRPKYNVSFVDDGHEYKGSLASLFKNGSKQELGWIIEKYLEIKGNPSAI